MATGKYQPYSECHSKYHIEKANTECSISSRKRKGILPDTFSHFLIFQTGKILFSYTVLLSQKLPDNLFFRWLLSIFHDPEILQR